MLAPYLEPARLPGRNFRNPKYPRWIPMRRGDRVKGPILVPFTLVLLLALGALLFTAYRYEAHARAHDLATSVRAVERLFRLQLDNDAAKLHATLCPISRDAAIKAAFLDGDLGALQAQIAPLFERLHGQHRVTHFYVMDAARKVVLRAHQPDMSGDVIDRATSRQAQESGRETQGLELGPLGTLTLRAVKPWYDGDTLIGYLELGEEIDHVAQEIHAALGLDLLVLVERPLLAPADSGTADSAGSPVIVSSTLKEIPAVVAERLRGPADARRAAEQTVDGARVLYTALLPITDAAGLDVGEIAVVRDVTELQTGFRNALITTTALILGVGGLVFFLFYLVLDRVERDYLRQRELETRFARLSTEHQRIVQIEKLSEVGRTIGEIAHQINNPLVGVINMAQLAEREADDPVRVRQLLGEIRRAGKDCHAFLQRMLAFTRVSRSERRPTEVTALVRDTIALFQQSTDRHPAVATDLPPPVTLDLDPVLVRHALFNLLANAGQVNPPEGTITVRLQPAAGPERRPGWSLAVIDQGPGLTDAVREKLFTPFFTTRPAGTGLGLAVVQHVAILHEGEATGDNHPGGGAIFAVWLPVSQGNPGGAT
jgi:signal transduction histidine kinase